MPKRAQLHNGRRSRVRIVTDSVSDLPPEMARRLAITVTPIYFSFDGHSYRDDGTLSRPWFYETLACSSDLPQTAAPAVHEFLELYRALVAEDAEEIIGLFLASSLSSLVRNAQQAAAQLEGATVHILETGQVSMGIGWLAVAAAEAAAQGATVEDITALVAALRSRSFVFGVLDSLEYLRRGGRISWTQARMAQLLKIKPVIAFYESEAHLLGRVRTYHRALLWLGRWVERAAPLQRLALLHSHASSQLVEQAHRLLLPFSPTDEVLVVEVGPIFGTHIGPNGIGVALVQAAGAIPMHWDID